MLSYISIEAAAAAFKDSALLFIGIMMVESASPKSLSLIPFASLPITITILFARLTFQQGSDFLVCAAAIDRPFFAILSVP